MVVDGVIARWGAGLVCASEAFVLGARLCCGSVGPSVALLCCQSVGRIGADGCKRVWRRARSGYVGWLGTPFMFKHKTF
jgi:hypothetical protein